MKKQHVNRWTSLWLALIMVLVSILGPVPAVMAQDFDPAEPALTVEDAATVPDAEMAEEEAAQVELPAEDEALPADEVVEAAAEEIVGAGGLTDFTSPQEGLTIDEEAGTVTLSDIAASPGVELTGLHTGFNAIIAEAVGVLTFLINFQFEMYRDREINVGAASAISLVQIRTEHTDSVVSGTAGVNICAIPASSRRTLAG